MSLIDYREGNNLDLNQVIELYVQSTLGERRPVHNRTMMRRMIENADIIITAWSGAELIGISRTLTDFCYVAYIADLAVHLEYQRKGVGKELLKQTYDKLDPTCFTVLLAAPLANEYYPKVGFQHNPRAWTIGPKIRP